MNEAERNDRWRDAARLALAVVAATILLVVFCLTLVEAADGAGYPLGYVVAASGLPLAGVILVFWFARRQERIDERHGFYET